MSIDLKDYVGLEVQITGLDKRITAEEVRGRVEKALRAEFAELPYEFSVEVEISETAP